MLTMLQPKRFRIKYCSSFFSRWFHHMDDLFLFCRYGTPLPAFSLLAGTGEEGCVKFARILSAVSGQCQSRRSLDS